MIRELCKTYLGIASVLTEIIVKRNPSYLSISILKSPPTSFNNFELNSVYYAKNVYWVLLFVPRHLLVQGAWNTDGKGESMWDYIVHTNPDFVKNRDNGDIACDSYNKYKEDIVILKQMGVKSYRFSIAWTRILPLGTNDYVNQKGIDYYRNLIIELRNNGIEPFVTIYHWDLPQILSERGGFLNSEFVDWYADYARILFTEFGELVHYWSTFNEPSSQCHYGYGTGQLAPGYNRNGVFDYICGHNLIKAHAKVYHMYQDEFKSTQNGEIGMVVQLPWFEPATNTTADIEAAETALQFYAGWFTHPLYYGDYSERFKSRIANRSTVEGRSTSRLPEFTAEEQEYIRGTSDYIGLNHYTSFLTLAEEDVPIENGTSFENDRNIKLDISPAWKATCTPTFKVVPWGIRKILVYLAQRFGNPPIYVTENGVCDGGELEDENRIYFLKSYLSNVRDAMEYDGVDVRAYTYWSFVDDFEWISGYSEGFGMIDVDFSSPNRTRTIKKSATVYKEIIEANGIVN